VRSGLALGEDELDRFLGCYLTRPKPQLELEGESLDVRRIERQLDRGERIARRLGARLLLTPRAAELWLFANGRDYRLEPSQLAWLEPLADGAAFDAECLKRHPSALPWLVTLFESGCLEWQPPSAG